MAVYKIFPTEDATLYSLFPGMNTGLDEIIEATTTTFAYDGLNPQTSRFLVRFSSTEINNVITNLIGTSSWDSSFNCYIANVTGLGTASVVEAWPIALDWRMGTGHYLDSPLTTDGVSWQFLQYSGSTQWAPNGVIPSGDITASYSGSNFGGGVWYTGSVDNSLYNVTQSLAYGEDIDLSFSAKTIVSDWYSSSVFPSSGININNNGFIVKQANNQEFVNNRNSAVELKYFSVDTHTIYPPNLEFKWVDYTRDTSPTISEITTPSIYLSLDENPGVFYSESINRFRINCRPKYPARVWVTSSLYTTQYYLPTASYYAIKDLDTNEYVVNFDSTYTQISADNTSSFFDVYMNGLQPERYYKILLQTTIAGSTLVVDDNYTFKIVNG